MKEPYYSMACRFHPDKNIGLDTSEMMKMINEAKFGLQDWLRTNDASREEERVRATEDVISIPSDHNSDSESSDTSSEKALSSSKESTLPAKHTNDDEETPLKNHILDHGHPKEMIYIQSRSYISCIMATITLNIYTHNVQDGYFYSNLKNLVMQIMKNFKIPDVRQ